MQISKMLFTNLGFAKMLESLTQDAKDLSKPLTIVWRPFHSAFEFTANSLYKLHMTKASRCLQNKKIICRATRTRWKQLLLLQFDLEYH